MQIALLIVVLVTLALGEGSAPGVSSTHEGPWGLLGVVLLAALPGLWAWHGANRVAAEITAPAADLAAPAHAARWVQRGAIALWLICASGILLVLDWPTIWRAIVQPVAVGPLDEILLLLPTILPLLLIWTAMYPLERAARRQLNSVTGLPAVCEGSAPAAHSWAPSEPRRQAAIQPLGEDGPTRREYVLAHVRVIAAPLLLPLLGLILLRDLVRRLSPGLTENGSGAVVMFGLLAVFFLLAWPWLLRMAWGTRPLPEGPLHERLRGLLARAEMPDCRLLIWPTGRMMSNAAAVGFLPHARCILVSDALLDRLAPRQVEAVVAHEVAHLRCRHLWLRGAAMLVPLSVWLMLSAILESAGSPWCELAGLTGSPLEIVPLLAVMACYAALVFGRYAQVLEHQADWEAARLLEPDNPRAGAALFAAALAAMDSGFRSSGKRRTWQHATTANRRKCLKKLATDARQELRFQRRTQSLNCMLVGVALAPLAVYLLLG